MIYDTPTKAEKNELATRKTIYLHRYTKGRHNNFKKDNDGTLRDPLYNFVLPVDRSCLVLLFSKFMSFYLIMHLMTNSKDIYHQFPIKLQNKHWKQWYSPSSPRPLATFFRVSWGRRPARRWPPPRCRWWVRWAHSGPSWREHSPPHRTRSDCSGYWRYRPAGCSSRRYCVKRWKLKN